MKVGFIGLGTMGGNAAKNVIRAGFETYVFDLRREAANDHIAMGAGVPMVCGMMDYKRKLVELGPAIWPTGNYEADMVEIGRYYSQCTPKYPDKGHPGIPGGVSVSE